MAENKKNATQAQKAADEKKKNRKKKAVKNDASSKKVPAAAKDTNDVSPQIIMGLIAAMLLLLFCGMAFSPEGVVLKWIRDYVILGLFGKGAFYVTIPCLLFLAVSFICRTRQQRRFGRCKRLCGCGLRSRWRRRHGR